MNNTTISRILAAMASGALLMTPMAPSFAQSPAPEQAQPAATAATPQPAAAPTQSATTAAAPQPSAPEQAQPAATTTPQPSAAPAQSATTAAAPQPPATPSMTAAQTTPASPAAAGVPVPTFAPSDIQGLDVFGSEGHQIGKVIRTNSANGNVNSIDVQSNGLLGYFKKTYEIPVASIKKNGQKIELSMTSEEAAKHIK
jgi:hypothetical protein